MPRRDPILDPMFEQGDDDLAHGALPDAVPPVAYTCAECGQLEADCACVEALAVRSPW